MRIILAALVLSVSACATTQTPFNEAKNVPADRLLAYQTNISSKSATIIVTRDSGFVASACYLALNINGKLAARLATAETARFYLPAGEHTLRVDRDPSGNGLCGVDAEFNSTRETNLKSGDVKYFRIMIPDAEGSPDIQRVDSP
jgi:hypothetical protein